MESKYNINFQLLRLNLTDFVIELTLTSHKKNQPELTLVCENLSQLVLGIKPIILFFPEDISATSYET